MPKMIHTIDSHTAGEPTRVIVDGGPDLGSGKLSERLNVFRDLHDDYRKAVVCEPRGSDVLVGALLCESDDSTCDAAVIFFNNVGYLGMCGHGMIGVIETLRHLGRISANRCRIETPVGVVPAEINDDGSVSIENVASFRKSKAVTIQVDGLGTVVGDVAWGGNWFYLVNKPKIDLSLDRVRQLQQTAVSIRETLNANGYPEVDHVELFNEAAGDADSQNFVLCPGLEYDRSPCGTGTSAKLACLAADGKLQPGQIWEQAGILGTSFQGSYVWQDEASGTIIPTITSRAYVTAESKLLLNDDDPFCWGIG